MILEQRARKVSSTCKGCVDMKGNSFSILLHTNTTPLVMCRRVRIYRAINSKARAVGARCIVEAVRLTNVFP